MRTKYEIPYADNQTIRTWAWKNRVYCAEFGQIPWETQSKFYAARLQAIKDADAEWLKRAGDIFADRQPDLVGRAPRCLDKLRERGNA